MPTFFIMKLFKLLTNITGEIDFAEKKTKDKILKTWNFEIFFNNFHEKFSAFDSHDMQI